MTKRLLFLLFFLLSISTAAYGENGAELKDVVAALEQGYNAVLDLRADFSQRTSIASMNREQRGSGELFIKKGEEGQARFRFNYVKPQPQQIISDGRSVWYYLPEEKQVMVSSLAAMFEGGNTVALSYLTGMGHISRDFVITFVEGERDKKGNYLLQLVPRKRNQAIAKMHISVSSRAVEKFMREGKPVDPFPIVSSVVVDQLGNQTVLEFSRIRINSGLSPALFTFRIPPGVDIIKP